jgi:hypothetical protein
MNRVTQDHISDRTADGAAIVVDSAGHKLGVTFKVWGPKARAVFVNGTFNGINSFSKDQDHGGGFGGFGGIPEDREAIFFWDRQLPGDNNRSLYFTSQTHARSGIHALQEGGQ